MPSYSGGPKVGHKMKFYRNTGSVDTPVWGEVAEIGDLSLDDMTVGTAELKRRANKWTKVLPALHAAPSVSFSMIHGLDQDTFEGVLDDHMQETIREYAICNGDIEDEDVRGFRMPALLTEFPWSQALEDASGHECVAQLAYLEDNGEEVDPSWIGIESA